MASSSESIEGSFKDRVERAFGSLGASQSSSLRSLWSLTGEEVEKRDWKRGRDASFAKDRGETPCSSSFDSFFRKERRVFERNSRRALEDDLEDVGEDEGDDRSFKREDDDEHVWEVRSSIGLDSTLDNEEEEDEYDKVAIGRENAGERTFMRDVNDHGPYLNSHNVLPNSLNGVNRDPRANHLAARIRLKEDEAAALNIGSRQACDPNPAFVEEPSNKAPEDLGNLKPILKRKENGAVSKSKKRVRFDPSCESTLEEISKMPSATTEPTVSNKGSPLAESQSTSKVPDYVLNPSKYTCYSLDLSGGVNEVSNTQNVNLGASTALPKSVTFIPKKKASDAMAVNNSGEVKKTGFSVGIGEHDEGFSEEEEEPQPSSAVKVAKAGRQYRRKARADDS